MMAKTAGSTRLFHRLRKICLALPEAREVETWGHPTFRVNDKIFAACGTGYDPDGRPTMSCKAPPGEAQARVAGEPDRFFKPPYVGGRGWLGVYLDGQPDWAEIGDLVEESYRITAPKRLVKLLG